MTDMSKFKIANAFKSLDPNEGLADGIAAGFSSIRYRGKLWSLSHGGKNYPFKRLDDGSPLTYIDVVILGISPGLSKAYFGDEKWTEESASGPVCYSLKGDVPDPGVPIQQSKTCGICPNNEWITKPDGGRGKACQDHKRMAVLLLPTMTKKMLGAPLLEPVHLKIPPGSLKSLKKYSDELQSQGIHYAAVVTRVSFSSDRIFEMNFETVQALTDAEAPRVFELRKDPQTKAIMGSISEVRQIAPPPPPAKVETGLLDAFGQDKPTNGAAAAEATETAAPAARATPKSRGRPRRAAVIENEPEPEPQPSISAEMKAVIAEAINSDPPWEESDTDLDASVAKLLGDKLNKMMK